MCEYCGCQALTAIASLTQEHDDALDHVRKAERALDRGDDAAVVAACADLRAHLRPHTAVEEDGLFPALVDDFPEQIAALHREHESIEVALDEAAGEHDLGWQARLREALSLLRNHILKEQDGVSPAALSILTPAQWERVESSRVQVRGLMEEVLRG
jgi:hemerythrin-like domain-containing protein